ncbi:MAG: stage III sporulation AC/AD family protein [Oscillospiraceae bacterium]|nr:stage III sporulation AC/AD family protein [Oscillospiraceae bacterium]
MELLVKLAALSLCVSAVALLLRRSDEALALILPLAALIVGCALLLPEFAQMQALCSRALALTGLPAALFTPLAKVIGISLVTRFSCALCADAGQSALSALLGTAGAVCALVCALPLVSALLDLVEGFL